MSTPFIDRERRRGQRRRILDRRDLIRQPPADRERRTRPGRRHSDAIPADDG